MKKYIKDIFPAFVLSLVGSFMLFINEPIMMLASNVNDFWFDLSLLIKFSLIPFFALFVSSFLIFNILYFINKKIFNLSYIIYFIVFFVTYIQGNYLVGSLPVLDGTPIAWNGYFIDKIISIVLLFIIIAISILLIIKFKASNYIKYSAYLTLAIFAMLGTSLVTTLLTTDGLDLKGIITTSTFKDFNKYSDNENIIVLLLDATDSDSFYTQLNKKYNGTDILEDFTYYPDTVSSFIYTRETIPYILSGEKFINQSNFQEYSNKALKDSTLFKNLKENNYSINVYSSEIIYNDASALELNNFESLSDYNNINYKSYIKNEIKYVLFKYLPYYLKQYSQINTLQFELSSVAPDDLDAYYFETNSFFAKNTLEGEVTVENDKVFKFIHLDGAHVPFDFDSSLNEKEDATYSDELDGCITMVKNYLNMLKANGIYDNSSIIIMADHGFNDGRHVTKGRQNPILFIKGKNERHSFEVSDVPISYEDLQNLFNELMDGKKTSEMFKYIDNNRERLYLDYSFQAEEHMEEYATKDKAWEFEKYYKTGKEYNQ